jgi:hypothetical protein
MSQAYGQTSLRHTAGRVAKIFLRFDLNTVSTHMRITYTQRKEYELPCPSHNV